MARWACVDVPALPLQLLLARHPDWAGLPAAVAAADNAQARLLWLNEHARRLGVLPGLRCAAALALARDLRVGVVGRDEIDRGVAQLTARLRDFSPGVEPCVDAPGVFWLDGDGLECLFPSASAWAREVHAAVRTMGFNARVVVGFTRYGTYAVAVGRRSPERAADGTASDPGDTVVFRDPAAEQLAARSAPLDRLGLDPKVRDDLDKLGVRTLGDFLELPAGGVHERFDEATARVHQLASGAAWAPLQPCFERERLADHFELGCADDDLDRLLFYVKRLLDPLLARLAPRGEAAAALRLGLLLETRATLEQTIRPAAPTRDAAQLLDLARLWLENAALPAGVEEIDLEVIGVPLAAAQQNLLAEAPRRDVAAANRALARLRAELGAAAVVRARLVDEHLPESSFLWAPLEQLESAPGKRRAPDGAAPTLVRRIFEQPAPLPPRPHHLRDDGWLIRGPGCGAVVKFTGPYVLSGGWWVRPWRREYHFAESKRGDLLWVYYDQEQRRWFLQGRVE